MCVLCMCMFVYIDIYIHTHKHTHVHARAHTRTRARTHTRTPSSRGRYIRPFLMGSGPILGLQPCREFQLMVSVTPVGNYFGKGGLKGIHANVMQNFDRAAPHG